MTFGQPLREPALGRHGMIVGVGTDIVEIVRIGQMIERHGEHFLRRVYTEEEIRYCQRRRESYQHFAGRWAAKEAVMKTLGTGWTRGVGWLDIEVATKRSGQPVINVRGTARDIASNCGIDEVLISISHCRAYATATAIALRYRETDHAEPEIDDSENEK
jgi:holo-[acyl-carrier protein] synthase